MYSWERSNRISKNPKIPSFSSSLLDEIYMEIDGGNEKYKDLKQPKEKHAKKQSNNNGGGRGKASSVIEDEEMASLWRARVIEKWMEEKVNEKISARRGSLLPEFDPKLMQDNDPLFFTSSSCSSDSSFRGFSSSETESLGAGKSKTTCFPAPKPIRTKLEHSVAQQQIDEFYLFDDYRLVNHQTNKTDEGLIKSKTRVLKIYSNLKKMKQPISPGGRLASFINLLFTNGNPKKNKNFSENGDGAYELNGKTQASTCSSASSFSRSCLSKKSPASTEKISNGMKRTVKFSPVSVIIDEESCSCGHKSINDGKNYYGGVLKQNQKKNDFVVKRVCDENDDDGYEDDTSSYSSSDLFELDHLTVFKDDKFCEDPPVYETTHFGRNHGIASVLIH